jgi:hypothetical protein
VRWCQELYSNLVFKQLKKAASLADLMLPDIKATKEDTPLVAYADDFVITGASEAVLRDKVKPVLEAFLDKRGLELSKET